MSEPAVHVAQSSTTEPAPRPSRRAAVFRHRKRPRWGLAAFLWERDGKRGYQFQDGRVRVFKEGFFDMLEPVAEPKDAAAARSVARLAARNRAGQDTNSRAIPRVADQIALFSSQYPEGFEGKAWRSTVRGEGAKRHLKRHRDLTVALAAEKLDKQRLAEAIELERWAEVLSAAVEVLRTTDMVSKKDVDRLAECAADKNLAWAIYDLLHGEEPHANNVEKFVRALKKAGIKKPNWQIVTALPAVVSPKQHLWIRPSVFKQQAKMVKPNLKLGSVPKGRVYAQCLEVVDIVGQELEAAGRHPRDHLDLAQFMWVTLRPSARERLVGANDETAELH